MMEKEDHFLLACLGEAWLSFLGWMKFTENFFSFWSSVAVPLPLYTHKETRPQDLLLMHSLAAPAYSTAVIIYDEFFIYRLGGSDSDIWLPRKLLLQQLYVICFRELITWQFRFGNSLYFLMRT
jgi:hypothetical protein